MAVAIAAVNGQIEGIEAGLSELTDYVMGLEEQLDILSATTLSNIVALQEDLETQKAAVEKLLNSTTDEALAAELENVIALITDIQNNYGQAIGNLEARLNDVEDVLAAKFESQETFIAQLSQVVNTLVDDVDKNKTDIESLWAEIAGEDANSIRSQMGVLANNIVAIQGELETLHVLVASRLASLTFIPKEIIDGVEGLTYGTFTYNALTLVDKDSKDEIAEEATAETEVTPAVYAYYKVSPLSIDMELLKDKLAFTLVKDADYIATRAASTEDFSMTPEFVSYDAAKGILEVKVNIKGTAATGSKMTMFALQVDEVTSDYATVLKNDLADIEIADEMLEDEDAPADNHYRRAIKGINGVDADAAISSVSAWNSADGVEVDAELVYNDKNGLDLNTIVFAHEVAATAGLDCPKVANIEKFGFVWKYEVVKNYGIGDPVTPQEEFVSLSEEGVLKARVYDTEGRAAIGRTPIIRASLVDTNNNNAIVKCAYIKVRIVDADAPVEPVAVTMNVEDFEFVCGQSDVNGVTVREINLKIYNTLGLSYEQFLNSYPTFEDWGALQTPAHVGTVTASNNSSNPGEGTDVISWTLTEEELWANAGEEVSHIIRYYNASGANYVAFELKANVKEIQKEFDLKKADFISNYWDANKTYTMFNVAVPTSTTDDNAANCTFINNLNAPFTTWAVNNTENAVPGLVKLDARVTDVNYFFCKEVEAIEEIGSEEKAVKVTFIVSADGQTLSAYEGTDATLAEVIATIDNDGTGYTPSTIEYNKTSDLAKKLLNTDEMYTLIGAVGEVCDDDTKTVSITFEGEDHFKAEFIRPVNISEQAADNFIDGVDFGEKGSFIRLEDLIAPYDWRGRQFSDYENYWGFYGDFKISVDVQSAQCNLNGVHQAVPVTVQLDTEMATAGSTITMGTGADALTSKYGFLTYKNNGTNVSEFEIYVKVTVEYGWGIIETEEIVVKVDSTINN